VILTVINRRRPRPLGRAKPEAQRAGSRQTADPYASAG
jgi:hypothetical protein